MTVALMPLVDVRLRSTVPDAEVEAKVGKMLTDADYNVLLTGPARIRKPDGSLLAIYLPGYLADTDPAVVEVLSSLKTHTTNNRGMASGTPRVARAGSTRSSSKAVASAVVGAMDPSGPKTYCRLTAWSGRETEQYATLWPLLERISDAFLHYVPDRAGRQADVVAATHPDWVIPGTIFTTLTVNNTYPTGVHQDKGDLPDGFSTICAFRRGSFSGGRLVLARYRVAVDLGDGDLLLFDPHEWHGNTPLVAHHDPGCPRAGEPVGPPSKAASESACAGCRAERISLVSYYRTKMATCGSAQDEADKAIAVSNRHNVARTGGVVPDDDIG